MQYRRFFYAAIWLLFQTTTLNGSAEGPILFEDATNGDFEITRQVCNAKLTRNSEDSALMLSFHGLYRSSGDCVNGKRSRVCATYIVNLKNKSCEGVFYTNSAGIYASSNLIDRLSQNPFNLPELSRDAESFERPIVFQSLNGEVALLEAEGYVILVETE